MEIAAEVVSETVTSLHLIGDAWGRDNHIGSKAKIVDKGEEHCDVVGEGLGRVKFSDGGPEQGCCVHLFAPDNCPPKFEEFVLWDGEASGKAEITEVFPNEEILEGVVSI